MELFSENTRTVVLYSLRDYNRESPDTIHVPMCNIYYKHTMFYTYASARYSNNENDNVEVGTHPRRYVNIMLCNSKVNQNIKQYGYNNDNTI